MRGRKKGSKNGVVNKRPYVKAAAPDLQELIRQAAQVVLDNLEARKIGAPTKYHPGFCHLARQHCVINATGPDVAELLGTTTEELYKWAESHPDFVQALKEGKARYDEKIERALAERALGYSHSSEKIFLNKEGEIVRAETTEHYPPDPTSIIWWLKNRKPDQWRDRREENPDDETPPPVKVTIEFKDGRKPQTEGG